VINVTLFFDKFVDFRYFPGGTVKLGVNMVRQNARNVVVE
jgi:hypothetical protein